MFFKDKNKKVKEEFSVSPKIQTAEGWKRAMRQKIKGSSTKKNAKE